MKLIRCILFPTTKKVVQPKLQVAYKNMQGFYVNAPKRSKTDVKKILGYIGGYMKRGLIALHRIIYD
ncbi:hypothetical protein GCM10012290_24030 [Halolactibacillus alkaliphilus]|uniref:Uncharacterized protein n=1 Tax=Halolactibacillus alkaliphilus TaxID=442899 RepID=A0A511X4F1_9BACI|nr:hypothetical protein [Halolactibacillus alkaliphilus]GEN57827.1 hypothetical protein HAL01_22910 [Halolactibacillus alkaliphilus]GGN75283.1 hypothetical protein GCM10012290_24030 [Halolactibacillus alkaliphilus]